MIIAGLTNNKGELFTEDGKDYAVISGSCFIFPNYPDVLLNQIDNSTTIAHHKALDEMNIFGLELRRSKWCRCNVANADAIADYDPNSPVLTREVVSCSLRGSCKHEGILCLTNKQVNGITPRQIEVLTLIGKGLLNKEIADVLNISENTVSIHNKALRDATGCQRKADLTLYAQKLNLINS